jgi:steroid delta-isomerase
VPTAEQIHAAFETYASAVTSRDRAALLACFTDDIVQVDPYPSPPNVGKDAVLAFFEQTWAMAAELEFVRGRAIVGGDRGVFPFTIVAAGFEIDAVDVMTITDDGLISEITAYVDMAGMRPAG